MKKKKISTSAPAERKNLSAADNGPSNNTPSNKTTSESEKFASGATDEPKKDKPAPASPPPKPKVGVVFGSNGIKAFSALPLIEHLDKENIKVDMVTATSGGALLAALRGLGYDLKHIISLLAEALDKKHFSTINYASMLELMNLPTFGTGVPGGLLRPSGMQAVFKKIFKDSRVEDLRPKTVFTTTDAITGTPVVLEEGDLADAVYAASAVYPAMPPIKIGNAHLVDGSFSDPLPVMESVKRGMDVIMAVYFDDDTVSEPEGFMQHMFNAAKMHMRSIMQGKLPLAIAMHSYEIVPMIIRHHRPVSIWDVERIKEIIHAGKVELSRHEAEIKSVMKNFPPETKQTKKQVLEKLQRNLDDTMVIKQYQD